MTLDEINQHLDETLGEFEKSFEASVRVFGRGLSDVIKGAESGKHDKGIVGALVLHRLREMQELMVGRSEKVLNEELYK